MTVAFTTHGLVWLQAMHRRQSKAAVRSSFDRGYRCRITHDEREMRGSGPEHLSFIEHPLHRSARHPARRPLPAPRDRATGSR